MKRLFFLVLFALALFTINTTEANAVIQTVIGGEVLSSISINTDAQGVAIIPNYDLTVINVTRYAGDTSASASIRNSSCTILQSSTALSGNTFTGFNVSLQQGTLYYVMFGDDISSKNRQFLSPGVTYPKTSIALGITGGATSGCSPSAAGMFGFESITVDYNPTNSNNLSITATDLYNGATITSFNASVTGTGNFISLLDKSGNGNNLTNNGATYNSSNDSYLFDSNSDFLQASYNEQLNITTEPFTLTAWINPSSATGSTQNIISQYSFLNFNRDMQFFLTPANNIRLALFHDGTVANATGISGSTIRNNELTFVTGRYNGTHLMVTVNSTISSNISTPYAGSGKNNNLIIGNDGNSAGFFNGSIKDVRVWNRSLSAAEVATVYANGSVTYGLVALYDFNDFGNFNYTTTTSQINTSFTVNSTQTANITVSANNYFPATRTNYNTSTLAETLYQAVVGFTAEEIITGTPVTTYTVCSNSVCNTSTNPMLYVSAGTHNFTFNKTGWFNKTFAVNVTALTSTIYNMTDVYRYLFNFTVQNSMTGVDATSFQVDAISGLYTYSINSTTTNGSLLLPWTNDTNINLTMLNAATVARINILYNTSNYTGAFPAHINLTFSGFTTNSFLFTIYNETTDTQLTQNATIQLISPFFAANYTFTGGAYNATLLFPADYQIIYWVDADVPREYYTTLSNQSVQTLRLYTIDLADRELYSPVALSQFGRACGNQTVSLLRYFIDGNSYRTVEMALTDTNGAAVLSVQPNIINYKLQFVGSCGDYTSDPQKITAASNSFTITEGQSPLATLEAYDNIARSLTYDENTDTFVFNWADTDSTISEACLTVTKTKNGVRTTDYSGCLEATSGSLIRTINDTNQTIYKATGTITLASGESFSDTTSANYLTSFQVFGQTGIFLTLVVLIVFATFGAASPDLMVISGVAGIALMGVMTFVAFDWTYFVGIVIIAIYIAYRAGRT